MKIKTTVERGYSIDYEAVFQEVRKLKAHCERMEYKADTLNKSVPSCHDEIISVNYKKTREITEQMLKKINMAEEELGELLTSCKKFAEKIEATTRIRFPI